MPTQTQMGRYLLNKIFYVAEEIALFTLMVIETCHGNYDRAGLALVSIIMVGYMCDR
ncbi:MAG TPA: hypothetical protein P5056_02005 [Candidatus Paceibacterota bacterium]|nr:hypothetical protein [Candidatus Paceibacterota bacterium]